MELCLSNGTHTFCFFLIGINNKIYYYHRYNFNLPFFSPEVEIKYIGGKDPEMLFLDDSGNVSEVNLHLLCYLTLYKLFSHTHTKNHTCVYVLNYDSLFVLYQSRGFL